MEEPSGSGVAWTVLGRKAVQGWSAWHFVIDAGLTAMLTAVGKALLQMSWGETVFLLVGTLLVVTGSLALWIRSRKRVQPFTCNYRGLPKRLKDTPPTLGVAFTIVPRSATKLTIDQRARGYLVVDEVSTIYDVFLKATNQVETIEVVVTASFQNAPGAFERIQARQGSGMIAEVDLRHLEVYFTENGIKQRLKLTEYLRLPEIGWAQPVVKGQIRASMAGGSASAG